MKSMRARLSYANVMSTVALFVALGGASYAAVELPRNSVGSRQIRNGAVTAAKLGFPLSTKATTATASVTSETCPLGASCPPELPQQVATARVRLARPGAVLILAQVQFSAPSSGSAITVKLSGTVDQSNLSATSSAILGAAEPTTVSYEAYAPKLSAGIHKLTLFASPRGNAGGPLTVSSSVVTLALPPEG